MDINKHSIPLANANGWTWEATIYGQDALCATQPCIICFLQLHHPHESKNITSQKIRKMVIYIPYNYIPFKQHACIQLLRAPFICRLTFMIPGCRYQFRTILLHADHKNGIYIYKPNNYIYLITKERYYN